MFTWDSEQYLRFKNERTLPAIDLVSRIKVDQVNRVIDIGCGPGNSTAVIKQRWSDADIYGLDSSAEMLAKASSTDSDIQWIRADIAEWNPADRFDVIISNAALHWLPNHQMLLPRLMGLLNSGGALAVQIPARYNSEAHNIIVDVAKLPQWYKYTKKAIDSFFLEQPSFYYDVLISVSSKIELWETKYFHIMDDCEAILNWFRGTALKPYSSVLSTENDKKMFEEAIYHRYQESYPQQKNGKILLSIRRLFFIAYK